MIVRLEEEEARRLLDEARRARVELTACPLCELVGVDRAALRVAESRHGVVVLDEHAASRGHLLVIARDHVESGAELPWAVFGDLSRLVWEATRAVDRLLEPERIYTATFEATEAHPMTFPHHHTHVIPVYDKDERARPAHVLSRTSSVPGYAPGEAERLARDLRRRWGTAPTGTWEAAE